MKSPHSKERIPSLLHTVNAVGFLSFLTIIFFGTTEREAWLALSIVLGGAFISLYLYYRLRSSYKVVSAVFSFSLCIFMYVAFAESIFFIENITGIGISRRISMGIKLQQRAVRELKKKDDVFELAGKDPLFYHRVPGSIHRYQYDHEKPNPWYEAVVDETGYLNVR